MASQIEREIQAGERFRFGRNWREFLGALDEDRIAKAEQSFAAMIQADNLSGKTFLDIGSGSGLSSLVARRFGAEKVHSFDYDPESVACTRDVRAEHFPDDERWTVEEGSVLDREYLSQLGEFDFVYSWGVLHHTGKMWEAIENAAGRVKIGGTLLIAIYNDQGRYSVGWKKVKEVYCLSVVGRLLVTTIFVPYFFLRALIGSMLSGRNHFAEYRKSRGMSIVRDWFDWLGGLPFEVASVEALFDFLVERGFELRKLRTVNNLGNNELVFVRQS